MKLERERERVCLIFSSKYVFEKDEHHISQVQKEPYQVWTKFKPSSQMHEPPDIFESHKLDTKAFLGYR